MKNDRIKKKQMIFQNFYVEKNYETFKQFTQFKIR